MTNSKEAYKNMTAKIGLHAQMIMSQLPYLRTVKRERFGWYVTKGPVNNSVESIPGATCEEISRFTSLTEMQVVRRMSELKKAGLVIESHEKFTYTQDGRKYHKTIWCAVEDEK